MAIDFSKLSIPAKLFLYTYKCEKCGEEEEYVQDIPEWLLKHTPIFGSCYGKLVFISKREYKR